MKKKRTVPENLFELCPSQLIQWEAGEGEKVVVLVPKFRNRFAAKWVMPRLSKPYVRVKLDEFGSFVWKQCDGKTTVAEIADRMKAAFGTSAEPVDERVPAFLIKLAKTDLVTLNDREIIVPKE